MGEKTREKRQLIERYGKLLKSDEYSSCVLFVGGDCTFIIVGIEFKLVNETA